MTLKMMFRFVSVPFVCPLLLALEMMNYDIVDCWAYEGMTPQLGRNREDVTCVYVCMCVCVYVRTVDARVPPLGYTSTFFYPIITPLEAPLIVGSGHLWLRPNLRCPG